MKIIQIWWNETDMIPKKYQQLIKKNEIFLSKFDWKVYTKTDILFLLEKNKNLYEKFKNFINGTSKHSKDYLYQTNFLRCFLLYLFGGIYLDLDVEINLNFEKFYYKINNIDKDIIFHINDYNNDIFTMSITKFRKNSNNLIKLMDFYTLMSNKGNFLYESFILKEFISNEQPENFKIFNFNFIKGIKHLSFNWNKFYEKEKIKRIMEIENDIPNLVE